ncbi:hypothetical protein C2E25_07960 [Geothermobacter hydrogeniphilus]|uniref:Uncharacterized protein n=1 Tax=Geothermobacter hydrogeniphilus TaxID=1969733 RepID=A0A2K2HAT7_9BACT|nr:hypothetical protein [Geothermobacter hydrogeniphilus]PNU20349.1 hypothetical protein C2E25_07960 [Geothermobacter hydrogeniphilus]
MKKLCLMLIVPVFVVACLAPVALAFQAEGDAYLGVYDKYLWRGFDLSGGMPVAQGGVDVSVGAFTVSYWSNLQLKNDAGEGLDAGEINETDLTLNYSRDLNDLVSISVGNIFYALDGIEDTNELYAGVSFNTIASPSLTVYYDWDKAEETGLFYVIAVEQSFRVMDGLSLTPGLSVSYNDESDYSVGNYSDFHDYEIVLRADYELTDDLAVSASYVFSSGLSDDAQQAIDSQNQVGVNVTLAF